MARPTPQQLKEINDRAQRYVTREQFFADLKKVSHKDVSSDDRCKKDNPTKKDNLNK